MNAATSIRLSIKNWAPLDRPSDKLQSMGVETLSDSELISILIGSGTAQMSAVDVAQHMLKKFDHNLNALGKARFDELTDIEGIGTFTACKIQAAIELGRRRQKAAVGLKPTLSSATAIYEYMRPRMADLEVEEFWVMYLNQSYKLIKAMPISRGGLTETAVDIRIIMREAVLCNATIIALAHDHPSGNTRPSRQDDMLTKAVKDACQLMRYHLLDHVIVTDGAYMSYAECGKL
mgnify:FL=1